MSDNGKYECGECGELFDRPIDLAKHVKSEHPKAKSKGQGGKSESYLTEEDVQEIREKEKRIKELELQLREAKLNAELRKLQSVSEPPREKTWILPDGTSFTGSSSDYREMLQLYMQMQSVAKKATSESENPTTIKALLDRIAELEKITTESKLKDVENKLNYIASRDPLTDASDAIKRFNEMATQQGLIKAGTSVADEVRLKHADVQTEALKTSIQTLSKKLDNSMRRAENIETRAMPVFEKVANLYVDDFRLRRGLTLGEPVPHSEDEIIAISRNLEKAGIEQEISNKPAETPETKAEPKPEPPKMKEFTGLNRMPGHDLSKED